MREEIFIIDFINIAIHFIEIIKNKDSFLIERMRIQHDAKETGQIHISKDYAISSLSPKTYTCFA